MARQYAGSAITDTFKNANWTKTTPADGAADITVLINDAVTRDQAIRRLYSLAEQLQELEAAL